MVVVVVVRFGAGVRAVIVAERVPGGRMFEREVLGLDVMVCSPEDEGSLDFFLSVGTGVLSLVLEAGLGRVDEASDMGGDGGSLGMVSLLTGGKETSEGGVEMSGELAVDLGEFSNVGDSGIEMSVDMAERWRFSDFLILSCIISASTLRSDSSSRNLCASIRILSLSCSPILISSSIITDLSMATLYLDSRSSSDEVVLRACLSKSSLATSISRNFSCIVRFVSRRVVISFSSAFCAELDSAFAFLHFS